MDRIDGQPVYSASDLVAYLACEHLTQLERAALAGLITRPMRDDPELDIIRRRGFQHEARFLADLRGDGRVVVEVDQDGSSADRGDALRHAQLAMQARPNRQHPFYWSSFIQAGEWANLDGRRSESSPGATER